MTVQFISKSFKRSKSGGGGETANSQFNNELELLDVKYKSMGTESLADITSEEYFTKRQEVLERAIKSSVTPNQRARYMVDLQKNQRDYQVWSDTNSKIFNMSDKQMRSVIEDNWRSLWQNKDIMRRGNIGAMAQMLLEGGEGSIDYMLATLEEMRSRLEEEPTAGKYINQIETQIGLLEDEADFYRGVVSRPNDYAAVFDTSIDGSVTDFKIKSVFDTSGYKDTGADMGGLKVFGKPHPGLSNEEGEAILIGNNLFRQAGDVFVSDKGTFDFNSLKNVPVGKYQPGAVLENSGGKYMVMQQDGSVVEYGNEEQLVADGHKKEGAIKITNNDSDNINSMYDVRSKESLVKSFDASKQLESIRKQYEDQTSVWGQLRSTLEDPDSVGEIYGEAAAGLGRAGVDLAKTAPEALKGFAQAGKELGSTAWDMLKTTAKTNIKALKTHPKRFGEAGRIFKGIFGAAKAGAAKVGAAKGGDKN